MYYRLKKKLLNIEVGEVFKEEEIPYNILNTPQASKYGPITALDNDFWEEITEDEYKCISVLLEQNECTHENMIDLKTCRSCTNCGKDFEKEEQEDHVPDTKKKVEEKKDVFKEVLKGKKVSDMIDLRYLDE